MAHKFYYISYSEYDLGQKGLIFRSVSDAKDFLAKALAWTGSTESVDTYCEDCLCEIKGVEIYERSE